MLRSANPLDLAIAASLLVPAFVVSILSDPEAKAPTVIKKSDIDEMEKTSKSMMPKALLDRFTKDEIFELLAYLEGLSASSGD